MTREALPNRRIKVAMPIEHDGQRFTASVGLHPDGRVGELFLNAVKTSSGLEALARHGAILVSLCVQFGCDLDTIRHALTRNEDGSAATIIGAALDAIDGRHGCVEATAPSTDDPAA